MIESNISGVYLLKSIYNNIDMLKIGCSKNIHERIKKHVSSNPLIEVIGYIKYEDYKWWEKEIHYKCRKWKYKGEWFYCRNEIIHWFQSQENFKTL